MLKPSLFQSFKNAFRGVFFMLQSERNFQIEVIALLINLFLIVFLKLNSYDAALILLVCFIVLSAEIFNTAIEKICDFIQPKFDTRIGFIKDISAAAVVLLAFISVIVGILIYSKYIS